MKKYLILAGLFIYAIPAAASLVLYEEPYELLGMVPPHVSDIFVLTSESTETITSISVGLLPNGTYELLAVDYPDGWTFYDWGLDAFGDGFHYWDLYNDAPIVPISPDTELLHLTIRFPQVVSEFELVLFDQDGNEVDWEYFVVAPEPAALSLLALGAVLARRKRK